MTDSLVILHKTSMWNDWFLHILENVDQFMAKLFCISIPWKIFPLFLTCRTELKKIHKKVWNGESSVHYSYMCRLFAREVLSCWSLQMWYMYGLLTKHEVKMAGYWPSSFLCVFIQKSWGLFSFAVIWILISKLVLLLEATYMQAQ